MKVEVKVDKKWDKLLGESIKIMFGDGNGNKFDNEES
jgi:hypothetical protein